MVVIVIVDRKRQYIKFGSTQSMSSLPSRKVQKRKRNARITCDDSDEDTNKDIVDRSTQNTSSNNVIGTINENTSCAQDSSSNTVIDTTNDNTMGTSLQSDEGM
jgi:hypothetical protein